MYCSIRFVLSAILLVSFVCSFKFEKLYQSLIRVENKLNSKLVDNINQDKSVGSIYTKFTVYYPEEKIKGSNIYLRGDSCNLTWAKGVPMKKIQTNTWSTSLLCPELIKANIKVLLNDTTWMMGANKVFIPSTSVDIYPSFFPQINPVVDTTSVYSNILKNSRKMSIYHPPSYFQNPLKKYPLVLLHDGQNLFDPSKAAFGVAWQCQDTANQLIVKGNIQQIVMVGIWNTAQRNDQYTYSYDKSQKFGGKGDQYLDFIQQQLIPVLTEKYLKDRIIDEKQITIGGSSLGGLISCYAAYTRPQIFNQAICMSSSFWWNSEDFNNKILTSKKYQPTTTYYLDSGDSGASQDSKNQTLKVLTSLKNLGYVEKKDMFYYLDKGGQHNQYYWGHRFWIPLTDIFDPERI